MIMEISYVPRGHSTIYLSHSSVSLHPYNHQPHRPLSLHIKNLCTFGHSLLFLLTTSQIQHPRIIINPPHKAPIKARPSPIKLSRLRPRDLAANDVTCEPSHHRYPTHEPRPGRFLREEGLLGREELETCCRGNLEACC